MSKQPNIVVVISHDLGQHLHCYGQEDVRSPSIDGFAESGIRFENAFTTAPQCSPARAALWTGRYPHANGMVGLAHPGFLNDLHADERHLSQHLRENGYHCVLFGGQHEARDVDRLEFHETHHGGRCYQVADKVEHYLNQWSAEEGPLFAEICLFEPHRPFPHDDVETLDPDSLKPLPYLPDIPVVREDLADLEASVHSMDKAFGRMLAAIDKAGIADNTIVIFTADHGIAFPRAKMTLYDPGLEVPLIIRGPGLPTGEVREEVVSHLDVLPTLLDLLDLEQPDNLHGRSFRALLTGGDYEPHDAIFAEKTYHTYYDPMRCIRTKRWKLIANFEFAPWQEVSPDYNNNAKSYVEIAKAMASEGLVNYHPPFELYDLAADPLEQQDLAEDHAYQETKCDLVRRLRQWMEETGDPLLQGPIPQGAYIERMQTFKEM